MIIKEIKTLDEVLKCVPYELKLMQKRRETAKMSDLIAFINTNLDNPLFKFWIVYDNDVIQGYCFVFLNLTPGFKTLYLKRFNAFTSEARDMLIKTLEEVTKELKIEKASITLKKNIRSISKKYDFKVVSVNLERRV